MTVDLDETDVDVLLESLKYSKQRVQDAQGTPYGVRKDNLERLEAVTEKLRHARNAQAGAR
jgi:hypothetical protein